MPPKKRKHSGLSGSELRTAYDSLIQLKKSAVNEGSEEEEDPNRPAPESLESQIDRLLSRLGSRLEKPQSFTFSSTTMETLAGMNITFDNVLALKPGYNERLVTTTSLGEDKLWSSANLYRHLQLLGSLVPRQTEASARVWIDAFFFRVSAMLPPDKHMVLNMEQNVPAATISPSSFSTLSGFVDYTAIVASKSTAASLLNNPMFHVLKALMPSGFFVIEAKPYNLLEHVPQAVCEMYACGKLLQKKVLRGALTNGHEWIFLLLTFKNEYDGASYKQSDNVRLETTKGLYDQPWPDLIAAILLHWIEHSFVDLGDDDWFERCG